MLGIHSNHSSMIIKNRGNHENFLFFKEFLVSKKVGLVSRIANKGIKDKGGL